jgi:outer membrane biosynthesis protein TonB
MKNMKNKLLKTLIVVSVFIFTAEVYAEINKVPATTNGYSNIVPVYPSESKKLGEQGTVTLRILVAVI